MGWVHRAWRSDTAGTNERVVEKGSGTLSKDRGRPDQLLFVGSWRRSASSSVSISRMPKPDGSLTSFKCGSMVSRRSCAC